MSESNAQNSDLSALKIDRKHRSDRPGAGKKWLHLLWLLLPVVLYLAYTYTLKEVTPSRKANVGTVRFLTGSDATADLVATGYVVAQVKAAVSSKATGRLVALNVEEGDQVARGEIIARIENDDIIANLDLYKAYLKQYRADSLAAFLDYSRQTKLLGSGHTTDEIVENATARYQVALANVEAGEAQVRAAEVAVENTIIRAPFDGTVLTKNADVGEMVAPMAASASSRGAVVTIADMSSLEVEADVSESNIQKVIVDQPCEIILDAFPDKKYGGYVKKIVPTADRSRATVMVKVAFSDKDDRVLPEMSARVNFLPVEQVSEDAGEAKVLVVDNDAVVMRDGQRAVFRFEGGYAFLTEVKVGRELGAVTEILSGLSAGEQVLLDPPGGLADGDKVEISN